MDPAGHAAPSPRRADRSRLALAAFMIVPGVLHFVVPRFYDDLIPSWVPGEPRGWTYASGVAELAAGVLVANRRTSRLGAWVVVAVLIGVYPANIWDLVEHPPTDGRGLVSLLRLPLQIPMIWWALRHTKPETVTDGVRPQV